MAIKAANDNQPKVGTVFLLMAQFGGRALVPLEEVRACFFFHLTEPQLLRKAATGAIAIPIVRIEASQKCAKGVHLQDLADYLDGRRAAALKEMAQMTA